MDLANNNNTTAPFNDTTLRRKRQREARLENLKKAREAQVRLRAAKKQKTEDDRELDAENDTLVNTTNDLSDVVLDHHDRIDRLQKAVKKIVTKKVSDPRTVRTQQFIPPDDQSFPAPLSTQTQSPPEPQQNQPSFYDEAQGMVIKSVVMGLSMLVISYLRSKVASPQNNTVSQQRPQQHQPPETLQDFMAQQGDGVPVDISQLFH